MVDAKAKVFAIRSCKNNESKGFKFSEPRSEQKGVVTISNKNLLNPLRAVTGEEEKVAICGFIFYISLLKDAVYTRAHNGLKVFRFWVDKDKIRK